MRAVTWCVVEEVRSGDWGIAGNRLTTADVKALAAASRWPPSHSPTPSKRRAPAGERGPADADSQP